MLAEGLAALLGQGAHLGDVGAGHESLLAAAGDNQRINVLVGGDNIHQLIQVGQYLGIQSVQRLGPVNGSHGDMLLLFQQNMGHIHSSFILVRRSPQAAVAVAGGIAPIGHDPPIHTAL